MLIERYSPITEVLTGLLFYLVEYTSFFIFCDRTFR